MKNKYFPIIFFILVFAAAALFSKKGIQTMKVMLHNAVKSDTVIVLDAGHGGMDPGKIGTNGALEKEVNLAIVYKLQSLLEQNDIKVVLTRTDDNGLYSESDSKKKVADLRKRVEIIEGSGAELAVSIHQNSFEQQSSKGAQVFYHEKSADGKQVAEIIQEQIKKTIGDGNHRVAKSNTSYYMLKKTACPLVIVECGFLSNPEEAEKLCSEEYQEKMAWAVHLGILQYLNNKQD